MYPLRWNQTSSIENEHFASKPPSCIGALIILNRCPSPSAHESESMLRTYLVCREKRAKRHVGEAHSVLITAILLPQRLSCYWGKIVPLHMLTTAQQRSTGQNLPSDLHCLQNPVTEKHSSLVISLFSCLNLSSNIK
jgi:hypothetical protein